MEIFNEVMPIYISKYSLPNPENEDLTDGLKKIRLHKYDSSMQNEEEEEFKEMREIF